MIVDRRKDARKKSAENRKKFLDRYKEQIKEQVDQIAADRSIEDIKNESKIKIKNIKEPTFVHGDYGKTWKVFPGNKEFNKGETIDKP